MASVNRRVLPGFSLSLGYTVFYLSVLVLLPIAACFAKASSLTFDAFWGAVWTARARSAYLLTFGASFVAAFSNLFLGGSLPGCWSAINFPETNCRLHRRPSSRIAHRGGWARVLEPVCEEGLAGAFSRALGNPGSVHPTWIVLVLIFVGLPFVVRTVQPVLQDFDPESEEASSTLGANRWQTFYTVILPALLPALITGFALAFARCIGEYGSVVFVSGNMPFKTEIAPILIVARLRSSRTARLQQLPSYF